MGLGIFSLRFQESELGWKSFKRGKFFSVSLFVDCYFVQIWNLWKRDPAGTPSFEKKLPISDSQEIDRQSKQDPETAGCKALAKQWEPSMPQ